MAENYEFANPIITNNKAPLNVKANSDIEAADKLWKKLNKEVQGHSDNFLFSIKNNMKGGDITHYQVKENREDQSYTIQKINANIDKEHFDKFYTNVMNHSESQETQESLKGGRRSSDSSSSDSSSKKSKIDIKNRPRRRRHSSTSSSSYDQYPTIRTRTITPIFNYFPAVYTTPTFNTTLNPTLTVAPIAVPRVATQVALWIGP